MTDIERLVDLLERIDSGKVKLDEDERKAAFEGMFSNVTFHVEGWELTIFNDCGDFDYIDTAITPEGNILDFHTLFEALPYRPPVDANVWWEGA